MILDLLVLDPVENFIAKREDLLVYLEKKDLAAELLAIKNLVEFAFDGSFWVEDTVLVGDGATLFEVVVDLIVEPR